MVVKKTTVDREQSVYKNLQNLFLPITIKDHGSAIHP